MKVKHKWQIIEKSILENLYWAPLIAAQWFILPYQASVDVKGLKIDSYTVPKKAFLIFVVTNTSATFSLITTVVFEIITDE